MDPFSRLGKGIGSYSKVGGEGERKKTYTNSKIKKGGPPILRIPRGRELEVQKASHARWVVYNRVCGWFSSHLLSLTRRSWGSEFNHSSEEAQSDTHRSWRQKWWRRGKGSERVSYRIDTTREIETVTDSVTFTNERDLNEDGWGDNLGCRTGPPWPHVHHTCGCGVNSTHYHISNFHPLSSCPDVKEERTKNWVWGT